jgi:hypothetical protein
MKIFAVDPGTTQSALVVLDPIRQTLKTFKMLANPALELYLKIQPGRSDYAVIERVTNQGRARIGNETLKTAEWVGSFRTAAKCPVELIPRNTVRTKIAGPWAKDKDVRQAVIEQFGGKEIAVGTKARPGPLYGMSGHHFQALATALVWWRMKSN